MHIISWSVSTERRVEFKARQIDPAVETLACRYTYCKAHFTIFYKSMLPAYLPQNNSSHKQIDIFQELEQQLSKK